QHLRAVEPDERPSGQRGKRLANLAGDARRSPLNLDPVDREERRLPGEQVGEESERDDAQPDGKRATRGDEPRKPRWWVQLWPSHPPRKDDGLGARHGPAETSPRRHA